MTRPTPSHRSFSQINQLRTCGEQYRLERIEKVPSRPSCPAVAGTAIHVGTETVDTLLHNSNADRFDLIEAGIMAALTEFDERASKEEARGWPTDSWRRYGRPTTEKPKGEDATWFRIEGIPNAVTAYVDWRLSDVGSEFVLAEIPDFGPAIEVPFNCYVDGQLVHGYIDRVFTSKNVGGYYPMDLKSGLKPKTDEQLGLYAQALRDGLDWEVIWGYYIFGLKTGAAKLTPPISLEHWTADKLQRVYGPANRAIELGLFIPAPGEACRHCSVTESCDFARAIT